MGTPASFFAKNNKGEEVFLGGVSMDGYHVPSIMHKMTMWSEFKNCFQDKIEEERRFLLPEKKEDNSPNWPFLGDVGSVMCQYVYYFKTGSGLFISYEKSYFYPTSDWNEYVSKPEDRKRISGEAEDRFPSMDKYEETGEIEGRFEPLIDQPEEGSGSE